MVRGVGRAAAAEPISEEELDRRVAARLKRKRRKLEKQADELRHALPINAHPVIRNVVESKIQTLLDPTSKPSPIRADRTEYWSPSIADQISPLMQKKMDMMRERIRRHNSPAITTPSLIPTQDFLMETTAKKPSKWLDRHRTPLDPVLRSPSDSESDREDSMRRLSTLSSVDSDDLSAKENTPSQPSFFSEATPPLRQTPFRSRRRTSIAASTISSRSTTSTESVVAARQVNSSHRKSTMGLVDGWNTTSNSARVSLAPQLLAPESNPFDDDAIFVDFTSAGHDSSGHQLSNEIQAVPDSVEGAHEETHSGASLGHSRVSGLNDSSLDPLLNQDSLIRSPMILASETYSGNYDAAPVDNLSNDGSISDSFNALMPLVDQCASDDVNTADRDTVPVETSSADTEVQENQDDHVSQRLDSQATTNLNKAKGRRRIVRPGVNNSQFFLSQKPLSQNVNILDDSSSEKVRVPSELKQAVGDKRGFKRLSTKPSEMGSCLIRRENTRCHDDSTCAPVRRKSQRLSSRPAELETTVNEQTEPAEPVGMKKKFVFNKREAVAKAQPVNSVSLRRTTRVLTSDSSADTTSLGKKLSFTDAPRLEEVSNVIAEETCGDEPVISVRRSSSFKEAVAETSASDTGSTVNSSADSFRLMMGNSHLYDSILTSDSSVDPETTADSLPSCVNLTQDEKASFLKEQESARKSSAQRTDSVLVNKSDTPIAKRRSRRSCVMDRVRDSFAGDSFSPSIIPATLSPANSRVSDESSHETAADDSGAAPHDSSPFHQSVETTDEIPEVRDEMCERPRVTRRSSRRSRAVTDDTTFQTCLEPSNATSGDPCATDQSVTDDVREETQKPARTRSRKRSGQSNRKSRVMTRSRSRGESQPDAFQEPRVQPEADLKLQENEIGGSATETATVSQKVSKRKRPPSKQVPETKRVTRSRSREKASSGEVQAGQTVNVETPDKQSGDRRRESLNSTDPRFLVGESLPEGKLKDILASVPRPSIDEFQLRKKKKKSPTKNPKKKSVPIDELASSQIQTCSYVICKTTMTKEQECCLIRAMEAIPGAVFSTEIDERTTHLVCGDATKRTLNVLKAISRGCWLVSQSWLESSLRSSTWAQEEPHELTAFPGARISRAHRSKREQKTKSAPSRYWNLLPSHVPLFVSPKSVPPREELVPLIGLCGGWVVNSPHHAKYWLGPAATKTTVNIPVLRETWVLDSISSGSVPDAMEYIME